MRRDVIAMIAVLCLSAPLQAQDAPLDDEPPPEAENGLSLMERGARLLMEGMMKEMEPALEGLGELGPMFRSFAQEMGPALAEIFEEVKDWSVYHPPELLPNGDVIIRRKTPEATPDDAPDPGQESPQDNEQIDI